MNMEEVLNAKTEDEAIDYVVQYQSWESDQHMSWQEVSEWSNVFYFLAKKFHLEEEFHENGLI